MNIINKYSSVILLVPYFYLKMIDFQLKMLFVTELYFFDSRKLIKAVFIVMSRT